MLFARVNRNNPEKIFIVVYNSYSVAMTNGQAVNWDLSDANGVSVDRPTARATNAGVSAAGIIAETIAVGGYGLMQVYGYHSSTITRSVTGGGSNIAKGTPLAMNSAGSLFCLESYAHAATSIIVHPCAFALEAHAVYTSSGIKVFIKTL